MGSALTIDAVSVLVNLDRATSGAASGFYREAGAVLSVIKTDAVSRWPVDTGDTKAGFALVAGAEAGELRSSIANPASTDWPAYKQTWSRYSKQDREDLLERAETGPVSPFVARAIGRGTTPAAKARIEGYFRGARLRSVTRQLSRLGDVPPPGLEKKQPWTHLIRKPAQAATGKLVTVLETDLVRLARGG